MPECCEYKNETNKLETYGTKELLTSYLKAYNPNGIGIRKEMLYCNCPPKNLERRNITPYKATITLASVIFLIFFAFILIIIA